MASSDYRGSCLNQVITWLIHLESYFQDSDLRLASFVTRPVRFQSETKMFASESMQQPCAALNAPALMSRGSRSQSAVAELDGKPVEQLGMCGPLSHYPEIFSRLHQPCSEKLVPHTIDGDACGEGILWADGPFRQGKPITRFVCGQRWKKVWRVGLNALTARRVHSAGQHMSIRDARLFPRNQRQAAACG